MRREIPTPLRAAAGLAAFAVDEARRLPNRLSTLPIVAIGAAMQASMKMQQRYAELVGRGDKLLGAVARPQEQPPWAHFDEDERATANRAAADRVADAQSWAFDAEDTVPGEMIPGEMIEEEIGEVAEDASEYEDYLPGSPDGAAARSADPAAPADLPALVDPPGLVDPAVEADLPAPADPPAPPDPLGLADPPAADEPPAAELPVPAESFTPDADAGLPLHGYDRLSLPQLRARLRTLSADDLRTLVDYERTHQDRPPYLTMLENRLTTVTGG
jgi:hypothetical protein